MTLPSANNSDINKQIANAEIQNQHISKCNFLQIKFVALVWWQDGQSSCIQLSSSVVVGGPLKGHLVALTPEWARHAKPQHTSRLLYDSDKEPVPAFCTMRNNKFVIGDRNQQRHNC